MDAARVLLRCEAGPEIGGGHVMRCLALADALAERGAEPAFCVNPGAEQTAPALSRSPFARAYEPDRAALNPPQGWTEGWSWTVIDLYGASPRLVAGARAASGRVAAFHDIDEPAPDADLLIDPAPNARLAPAPPSARLLKGPGYALIRPAVRAARPASLERPRDRLTAVTISLGLIDPGGRTLDVVRAVASAGASLKKTLILGPNADPHGQVKAEAGRLGFSVLVDPPDFEEVLSRADLVIGAGGGAALERCVLGLPSLVLVLADNQRAQADALAEAGVAELICDIGALPGALAALADQPAALAWMSRRAAAFCDGDGARRVAEAMLGEEAAP